MEASIERRTERSPRVPTDLLIELTHEDFDAPFEADAVDLGLGGLSMQASYLPEVGSRLRCRFSSPDDGRSVEAVCEVVWAQDSGPHVGRFGLRFVAVDSDSEDAIRGMVLSGDTPTDPDMDRPSEGETSAAHTHVDLQLDGVRSPVRGQVVEHDEQGVSVKQDLPFLALGTGLEARNGKSRRGRIDSVDLQLDGNTPQLVVRVQYDRPEAAPASHGAVLDTVPDFVPQQTATAPSQPAADEPEFVGAHRPDTESVQGHGQAQQGMAVAAEPQGAEPRASTQGSDQELSAEPAPQAVPQTAPETAPETAPQTAPARPLTPAEELETPEERPQRNPMDALRAGWDRIAPRLQTWFALCVSHLRPWLRTAWIRLRAWAVQGGRRTLPAVLQGVTRIRSVAGHFIAVLRARRGGRTQGARRKQAAGRTKVHKTRRTAAPPKTGSNVKGMQPKGRKADVARKQRRRTVGLSVLAFVGTGFAVYALSPSAESDSLPVQNSQAQADAKSASKSKDGTGESADKSNSPGKQEASGNSPGSSERASQEQNPAKLDKAPKPQEPGTVPPSSPYGPQKGEQNASASASKETPSQGGRNGDQPALTKSFGASKVPSARSFMLRMSQPVEGIRGAAESHGFSVTIPGTLSLDRAGPIASSHPAIERSMILNRGDHAVLTVRFVDGQEPAYRVVARNRAVEVLLEQ
jgi:hypothetical protein